MFNPKIFGIGLMAIGGVIAAIAIILTISSFRPQLSDAQLRDSYRTWGQGQGLEAYSRQFEGMVARENAQQMMCTVMPGDRCPVSGNVALITYLGLVIAGVGVVVLVAGQRKESA